MAECILLRAGGGGIDPDELTARPEDVAQGKIFGGKGSDEPQKGTLEVFLSPTISYGAEDDPASGSVIVNQPEGIYKRSEGEYYCKIKVSYDDMISSVGLVSFPETETLFGVKGSLPDFTNQTLERDGNTANVKLINNFFETDSGKGADVTIYLPRYGYYNETRITQAVYGIHPDVVQYGVPIGANPSGDGYHETGKFTGDATASVHDIRKGVTAYVRGEKVTGIMNEKKAATYTPNTTDQKIWGGQYLIGDQTIKGDPNLIAANIKKGVTIFGVTGTWEGYVPTVNDLYLHGNQLVPWSGSSGSRFDEAQIYIGSEGYIQTTNPLNLVGKTKLNIQYNASGTNSSSYTEATTSIYGQSEGPHLGRHTDTDGENIASFDLANAQGNKKIRIYARNIGSRYIKRIWLS